MTPPFTPLLVATLVALSPLYCRSADADKTPSPVVTELDEVAKDLTTDKITLRFVYHRGDRLRYRVEHVSTVETRMEGHTETSKSRSESFKLWQVAQTDAQAGTMQIENQIESVDMWSEVSGRKPVRFNSKTDTTPPAEYAKVAETLGKPLARITIDPQGRVVERSNFVQQLDLGMGGVSIPLPQHAVSVGDQWTAPLDIRARDKQHRITLIKTRQVFTLKSYSAGIATITIATQVLTPLHDPTIRSQIVQHLNHGELDWNETVIGFRGEGSNMKYFARLIEEFVPERAAPELADAQDRTTERL
jgi:hypothetical protein